MSMGHVQQVGTPLELYDKPANTFVAGFIGLPPMNTWHVTVREGYLEGKGFKAPLTEDERGSLSTYAGKEIILGVRPENISLGDEMLVKVINSENLGMNTLMYGYMGGSQNADHKVAAKLKGWMEYQNGEDVQIRFDRKHFFDIETTNAIRKEA